MSTPLDGLASGLSTTDLINRLMQLEKAPQDRLVAKRDNARKIVTALQTMNTKMAAVRSLAGDLAKGATWQAMTASSSADAVATASAGGTAIPGTLAFDVTSLASTGSKASTGTVSTTATIVTAGRLLLATGGRPLGVEGVKNTSLVAGNHTFEIEQASAGAVKTGTNAVAVSTVIGAGNKTLTLDIDGVGKTYTLTEGTYDRAGLAAALQTASNGEITVAVNGANRLVVTTVAEGSQATIQVTGGTAQGDLFLDNDAVALVGTDAIVDVEGTNTTIDYVKAGETKTLTSGAGGDLVLTMAGGLRKGTFESHAIETGGGTLSEVVTAINNANKGVAAAAVQVAPSTFRLQLSAKSTGLANDLTIASDAFSGLGALSTTSAAADAVMTVGSGGGAYTISSATNTVANALPGVTLTLKTTGETTITVGRDANRLADKLNTLVTTANSALTEIKNQTGFDTTTLKGGLLLGNFTVRSLQEKMFSAVIDPIAVGLGSAGLAGVSITKTGTLSFDRAKFLAAYAEDPDGVAQAFTQNGTATHAKVSLSTAADKTRAGTYSVEITAAATRAEKTGSVNVAQQITLAETIDVRVGGVTGTTISYAASAGESFVSIADALNERLAEANLSVVATVEGDAIVLRTTGYGTGASFEVQSDQMGAAQTGLVTATGAFQPHLGANVAGKIDGVDGIGNGQLLSAPAANATIGGLVLQITATPAEIGNLGTFTYIPGAAQRLATVGLDATDGVTGSISNVINGRNAEITTFTSQIERWDVRLAAREKALRRQFTAMETAMQRMQGQSQWLAGQIANLQANSAASRR